MHDRLERVSVCVAKPVGFDLTRLVTQQAKLRTAILEMARDRGPQSSICPSDAARAVGGEGWRDLMDDARDVARDLARGGQVEITQKGTALDPDALWRGPVRIRIR